MQTDKFLALYNEAHGTSHDSLYDLIGSVLAGNHDELDERAADGWVQCSATVEIKDVVYVVTFEEYNGFEDYCAHGVESLAEIVADCARRKAESDAAKAEKRRQARNEASRRCRAKKRAEQ